MTGDERVSSGSECTAVAGIAFLRARSGPAATGQRLPIFWPNSRNQDRLGSKWLAATIPGARPLETNS
jgi:hypothetical protein